MPDCHSIEAAQQPLTPGRHLLYLASAVRMPAEERDSTMSVNTAKVEGRRELHFDTLDDLRAELSRLEASQVDTIGNWTFGQILEHLAIGMRFTLDGPPDFKIPWYFKLMAPLMKNSMIYKPMRAGFKMPAKMADHVVPPIDISSEQALHDLRTAIDDFEQAKELQPHLMFGPLPRDQWIQYQLRHCELHLGFVIPQ
jgi:hypothetical protein